MDAFTTITINILQNDQLVKSAKTALKVVSLGALIRT